MSNFEEDLEEIARLSRYLQEQEDDLYEKVNTLLKGRKITVTDKNWNGQPCGASWPKLCGKTFVIDHACIDRGKICVWFDGPRHYCYMPIEYGRLES